MTTDAILAELRTLPGAPDSLRERVRALPEPQPRFTWTWPRIDVRRTLLVAAPAAVALAVGAAALHGVLAGGTSTQRPVAGQAVTPAESRLGAHAAAGGWSATQTTSALDANAPRALRLQKLAPQVGAAALPPSAT